MSNYKYLTPQLLLKAICNAIRAKTGSNDKIVHQDIPDELDNFMTEEEYEIAVQELSDIIYGSEMKILDSKYILSIPHSVFYCNNNLTTVNLPECTTIGNSAFQGCTNLTIINLPKCTSIGDSAFRNCTNLTTVNLPKCTSVSNGAFASCTSLTTINLPKCIQINSQVFYYCINLTTVILTISQIANLDIGAFINTPIANIYVPDNLVYSYKTATNWSTYTNQIKPISELPSELKEEYEYA